MTMGWAYIAHAAVIACGFGFYCIGVDEAWANQVIENVTSIVYLLAMLLGPVVTLYGLLRKAMNKKWSAASL